MLTVDILFGCKWPSLSFGTAIRVFSLLGCDFHFLVSLGVASLQLRSSSAAANCHTQEDARQGSTAHRPQALSPMDFKFRGAASRENVDALFCYSSASLGHFGSKAHVGTNWERNALDAGALVGNTGIGKTRADVCQSFRALALVILDTSAVFCLLSLVSYAASATKQGKATIILHNFAICICFV